MRELGSGAMAAASTMAFSDRNLGFAFMCCFSFSVAGTVIDSEHAGDRMNDEQTNAGELG
ncbi:hypothetical protein YK56LOC_60980 [Caballeronia sp. HLA56]